MVVPGSLGVAYDLSFVYKYPARNAIIICIINRTLVDGTPDPLPTTLPALKNTDAAHPQARYRFRIGEDYIGRDFLPDLA